MGAGKVSLREGKTNFSQPSTLKAQKLSSYLFAGTTSDREVKERYTRRKTSIWSASAYLTRNLRTAHSKPWTKERYRAWKINFSGTFKQPTVLPEERPLSGTRLKTTTKTTVHIHISIRFSGTLQASAIQGSALLRNPVIRVQGSSGGQFWITRLTVNFAFRKTVCRSYQLWTLNCLKIELKYGG